MSEEELLLQQANGNTLLALVLLAIIVVIIVLYSRLKRAQSTQAPQQNTAPANSAPPPPAADPPSGKTNWWRLAWIGASLIIVLIIVNVVGPGRLVAAAKSWVTQGSDSFELNVIHNEEQVPIVIGTTTIVEIVGQVYVTVPRYYCILWSPYSKLDVVRSPSGARNYVQAKNPKDRQKPFEVTARPEHIASGKCP